jgi:manganese transport protein
VILSMQLPFAVIPLIHFTSDRSKMGEFANRLWVKVLAWITAAVIVALNIYLVYLTLTQWMQNAGESFMWVEALVIPVAVALSALLLYLMFGPVLRGLYRRPEAGAPRFSAADLVAPPFQRIGVALEATDRDRAILAQAVPMAREHDAELLLIHVAEGMGPRFWSHESADEEVRSDRAYLERLQKELSEMGLHVDIHLGFGEPAKELVRVAEESQLSLLVLGTHGHRFPQDVLFGATATRVRHRLKIPVFMVRTDDRKG